MVNLFFGTWILVFITMPLIVGPIPREKIVGAAILASIFAIAVVLIVTGIIGMVK